mgnify:CR=1 FL=1
MDFIIDYLINGIKEEINKNDKYKSFLKDNPDVHCWNYNGEYPNKERYKRFRILLTETLKKQEEEIQKYY